MDFNVRVYIDGKEVNSSDLPGYVIRSKNIDLIVNDIIDRQGKGVKKDTAS